MKTHREDLTAKTGIEMAEDGGASQMFSQECGLCLFMVFIHWYLLLRQTWWHSGLPPGKAELLCLELQHGWTGTKQLRAVSHKKERRTPTDPGLDPGGYSGQRAVSNDGWWRLQEKRWCILEKELNLTGRGFVRISEGICQRLFTQLDSSPASPPQETETFSKHQKNKPGILAPRRRPPNSAQITILTRRGGESKSATLWFCCKNKNWKLRVLG